MNTENHTDRTALSKERIRQFRTVVYTHFRKRGRTLPWRTDYNPYHILVSEIMLQQTQVERVSEKFTGFIERFPAVTDLAEAPLSEVLALWQGLGYNRRAKALKEAAEMIVNRFDGRVPATPEELIRLPGIGAATAASITAFAFDKPALFLETNIRTVLIHHFFGGKNRIDDHELLRVAGMVLDRRNPRKWYSALMDYGTVLKKEVGNLSRRSVAYKKQTPFEGSRRQVRGAVLRFLLGKKSAGSAVIAEGTGKKKEVVAEVLEELVDEGILIKKNRSFRIAG